jgi:hypothetical protein
MIMSRMRTLVAGLTLILATNAVALVGVVYNRSGEPESKLRLTQRELRLPHYWGFEEENSGLTLSLEWRMLGDYGYGATHGGIGGSPFWLDKAKLATLGFDVSSPEDTSDGEIHYDKILPKEVLLVLELDGPAYQTVLEYARRQRQKEEALLATNPGNKEFEKRAKYAREQVEREERSNSRLFIVDAGLEAPSLRAQYPDRARYAIVRGNVQPLMTMDKKTRPRLVGHVNGLAVRSINLPLGLQGPFRPEELRVRTRQLEPPLRHKGFDAAVAFGKRLEPWITETEASK